MHLCKVCQAVTYEIVEVKSSLVYHRCTVCASITLEDAFRVDALREKKQYDQHNNSFENEGYVQMFETFIDEAITPYLGKIETALDFGSGPGPVLSQLLEERGLKVDIYDLYYAPLKIYEHKIYDLITSTEVFEHLSTPLEVLEMLVGYLNVKGYIVLMTKFPPKDDKVFLAWWYRRDPTHISFFTPKSFEVMAKKFGLKVLKTLNDNVVVFQKY